MSNITIMILGGGVMQLPALRIAKSRGWKIILADGSKNIPGMEYADIFENVDLKDKEKMAKTALMYKNSEGLNGVFTAGTDFSATVAWVAEKCGLPGIKYETAIKATDKFRMRMALENNGIPVPKYCGIGSDYNPDKILEHIDFPIVVKPVDNMGSRCVRRVESIEELNEGVKLALNASRTSQAIAEEYMDGPELSLDAVVYNGDIKICGIADRHIFFPPYFVEMGHTMPSSIDNKTLKEVSEIFNKAIKAIGIDNGAAKGDIKITESGIKIGEIAARLSGGYMSGWTYPYSSGIEITGAALNISAGLPPGNITPKEKSVSAERAFISIPGEVKKIYGMNSLKEDNNVKDVFLRIETGSKVVFPTNNVEKCGNVISKGNTKKNAVQAAEDAVRKIFIRLEPDNIDTDLFIFKNGNKFYRSISSYKLKNKVNTDALNNMPIYKNTENTEEINVMKLPDIESEDCTDWHGLKLIDAVNKVTEITGVTLSDSIIKGKINLGRLFWNVLLKGGVQAGVYIIDTIKERILHNKDPFDF